MTRPTARRAAFTLVELLVAIAILVALAALALLVVPAALEQDRTTDGASLLRQYLMISKARAARDQLPRGVRLISNPNGMATEIQYLESPPVFVPSPKGGWLPSNSSTGVQADGFHPYVLVTYYISPAFPPWMASLPAGTPNGMIMGRQVTFNNLTAGQIAEISPNSILYLPDLNLWIKLPPVSAAFTGPTAIVTGSPPPTAPPLYSLWFALAPAGNGGYYDPASFNQTVAPVDSWMGASSQAATFHFGIYGMPRPLIGEPTQQLPKNVGVDLLSSRPQGAALVDYDIMFAPNGQVLNYPPVSGAGQINLWVRDITKGGGDPNPPPVGVNGSFQDGGEQQVVALKTKSGALGVFPIAWSATNPFQFAQLGATAPE
jgi:prepilin-type N-terminal cleavage/methylation domain-containing protein